MPEKKLNPQQAKFIEVYLETRSRATAYIEAYGYDKNDRENARKAAYQLISTNIDVRKEIAERLEAVLDEATEANRMDMFDALDTRRKAMKHGRPEDSVKLRAAQDTLDRGGLKPKEEIEYTGQVSGDIAFYFGNKITEEDI